MHESQIYTPEIDPSGRSTPEAPRKTRRELLNTIKNLLDPKREGQILTQVDNIQLNIIDETAVVELEDLIKRWRKRIDVVDDPDKESALAQNADSNSVDEFLKIISDSLKRSKKADEKKEHELKIEIEGTIDLDKLKERLIAQWPKLKAEIDELDLNSLTADQLSGLESTLDQIESMVADVADGTKADFDDAAAKDIKDEGEKILNQYLTKEAA